MAKAKKGKLTIEDALVPVEEQPYDIPANWCWTYLLSGAAECKDGFRKPINSSERADREGDIPYYGATGQVGWIDDYLTDEQLVLLGEDGAPFLDLMKDKAYMIEGKAWVNNHAHILKSYYGEIGNKYLLHYLNTFNYHGFVNGTTRLKLTQASMNTIPVPIPPLAEQQRIVEQIENLFAKLDEAREKAQSALDEFETRKQAILYKAFSGGLSNEWREENNKSIEEWEYKQLGDTNIEIIDGDRGKNYPTKDEFSPEGYCIFLNAKNVTKNGFNFEVLECITKEKDELLHKGRLERGDMIMTTRGTLGNVAIYDETVPYEHIRINSGMVIYRGGEEIYKPYLIWLYKSNIITQQIDRMQTGSAQPQLPIKVMKSLLIPIPSVEEQEVIVDYIQSMMDKEEQVKSIIINVIDNIDMIKKSVLAKAFRGELGTNEVGDESSIELLKSILEK